MARLTIAIDPTILEAARLEAKRRQVTLDQMVADSLALVELMRRDFYQQRVEADPNPPRCPRAGSFFDIVQALAAKPTTLVAIIAGTLQTCKFTSSKSHTFVAKVRVRHALTRLGYLRLAK
jgi:hypothetical protein